MRSYLVELQNCLDQTTTILNQNLNEKREEITIRHAETVEKNINSLFKEADFNLMRTIEKEKLSTLSALYYKELIQNYEELGDHLYKANKTIVKLSDC